LDVDLSAPRAVQVPVVVFVKFNHGHDVLLSEGNAFVGH
jgi:hypothetical protein